MGSLSSELGAATPAEKSTAAVFNALRCPETNRSSVVFAQRVDITWAT
jgi:hypothetical protein